jgi:CRP-like cAMP-binding protein
MSAFDPKRTLQMRRRRQIFDLSQIQGRIGAARSQNSVVAMASRDKSNKIEQSHPLGMGGSRSTRQQQSNQGILSRLPEQETDTTIAAGTFLPLRGRLACTLLELAQEFGQDVGSGRIVIRQKISQKDVAAMAGIARENVSRIFNDWKRRKLLSQLSGYFCIENKVHLLNEAYL